VDGLFLQVESSGFIKICDNKKNWEISPTDLNHLQKVMSLKSKTKLQEGEERRLRCYCLKCFVQLCVNVFSSLTF
jgi:hypothetical protein